MELEGATKLTKVDNYSSHQTSGYGLFALQA